MSPRRLQGGRGSPRERANGPSAAALEAFHTRYWEALREGLAWHRNLPRLEKAGPKSGRTKRRTGDNLLLRLHRFKDDVLRFMVDFDVPFTNNLAEQALRMMKVKMKISGGFRTPEGAHAFAALRSVIATARKQGRNILLSLAAEPKTLATLIIPDTRWELRGTKRGRNPLKLLEGAGKMAARGAHTLYARSPIRSASGALAPATPKPTAL